MNLKIKAYASYFASFLINNLDDFSNLKSVILFGSVAREEAGKDSDIDIFIDVKKANKNYGFSVKGKKYRGFLEINNGRRLGKSCIIIPIENLKEFEGILKYYGVNARIVEVYV